MTTNPRTLIFTFGTLGDVRPYVALGSALAARGHIVTLSTGQGFDTLIEDAGLSPRSLSIDYRALLGTPEVQAAMTSLSGKLRAFRVMRTQFQRQYDEMWAVARDVKPDRIVVSPKGFAGVLIARALGVQCISTTLQPNFAPTREYPQFLWPLESLGAWGNQASYRLFNWATLMGQNKSAGAWAATALGLEPGTRLDGFHGFDPGGRRLPLLHGYSRHVVPCPQDWDSTQQVTGYWFLDSAPDWQPPPALDAFLRDGTPPVYVGFGSMPSEDAARVTRCVVDALAAANVRGVLARGWGGLDRVDHDERIHWLDSAPHDRLFPRCAAVVHHGGAGTTHEGLRWGRPTVICPAGVDQPFWGRRVAALGAGPQPLRLKDLDANRLAAAIRSALEPSTVARAKQLGELIRSEPGASLAAEQVCDPQ